MIFGALTKLWSQIWAVIGSTPTWAEEPLEALRQFLIWFYDFVADLWQTFANVIMDVLLWLLQYLFDFAATLLTVISAFAPNLDIISQISDPPIQAQQAICLMNWILPMDVISFCLSVYLLALAWYYSGGAVLRWLKITR
ncbi:MAG: hypothetical protein CSB34_06120 [Desulfobulbus propionicus]|nr:MAG: hypothetical protein CSB34_06120 [Desulfobulbus propionicus]